MNRPVFLLASERSGTNLLRTRIQAAQSTLLCPAPIHVLKILHGAVPYFGDLSQTANFERFVEAGLGLCREHFSPWGVDLSKDEVMQGFAREEMHRNAVGLMHVLYTIAAHKKGYASYLCKDNNLFDFAAEIEATIDGARFVFLCRDPRDFVVSQRKRPTQTSSVIRLAELWLEEQATTLAFIANSAKPENIHRLTYENLIADENVEIDALLSFLGTERTEQAEQVNEGAAESAESIHEWRNLARATIKENRQKYLVELSRRQINIIEAIAWNPMVHLGYHTESRKQGHVSAVHRSLERVAYQAYDVFKRRRNAKQLTAGQIRMNEYTNSLMKIWR